MEQPESVSVVTYFHPLNGWIVAVRKPFLAQARVHGVRWALEHQLVEGYTETWRYGNFAADQRDSLTEWVTAVHAAVAKRHEVTVYAL